MRYPRTRPRLEVPRAKKTLVQIHEGPGALQDCHDIFLAMTSPFSLGWFAPPELSRADLRRRARALWIVPWPFFAVVAVVLGIAVLVAPETLSRRATTVAAVAALITLLHAISRAGRPVLA